MLIRHKYCLEELRTDKDLSEQLKTETVISGEVFILYEDVKIPEDRYITNCLFFIAPSSGASIVNSKKGKDPLIAGCVFFGLLPKKKPFVDYWFDLMFLGGDGYYYNRFTSKRHDFMEVFSREKDPFNLMKDKNVKKKRS